MSERKTFRKTLEEEVRAIIDEPMTELSSEQIRIETEGVFDPEFDLSGIFSSLPSMLTATLGKVLTDSIKRMAAKPKMIFMVKEFEMSTKGVGPHNIDGVIAAIKERNKSIEDLLNDGWEIYEQIICPPNVMLIFSREKETEEELPSPPKF